MVTFLGRTYKPPLTLSPLKAPHTMTLLGCFTVLLMYLESYLETLEGLRTNLYPPRTSQDALNFITKHNFPPVCLSLVLIRVGVKYSTCTWYLYLSTYLSVLDVLEYLVHGNAKVLVLVLVLDH